MTKQIISPKERESKWQKYWEENKIYEAKEDYKLPKKYNLVEFPYPSGVGMHLGHIKAYIGMEVLSRKERLEGYNVLFPIGFDSFGLPAENYAIKMGIHPAVTTKKNEENFTRQLKEAGFSFDYSRIFSTTDPSYYKWTQWIFSKLFEKGLAYRDHTYVNYCPSCKVVLSNEDSQGGKCDRCGSDVIQKEKDVWFLKITDYADKLLEGLNTIDFPDRVKIEQENWIGKSTGAYVDFKIKDIDESLRVYTTRPDTLFGATFMVIAPEHPLIDNNQDKISNMEDIIKYREEAKKKTEFERVELAKDKTGVKIEGLVAINPVNDKEIPVYISDYVMMGYGTGAIMAVPAHDDRDYEFAQKFNIPIIQVLEEETGTPNKNETKKESIVAVVYDEKKDRYLTINWKDKGGRLFIGGTIKDGETPVECATREIKEETGYTDISLEKIGFKINHHYYAYNKDKYFNIEATPILFKLNSEKQDKTDLDEDEVFDVEWVDRKVVEKDITEELHAKSYQYLNNPGAMIGDGIHINSEILNGKNKKDAISRVIEFLTEKKIGQKATQYKMKDWAFNRQRYWGEPIPIIYCDKCGTVLVPEEELPLELPELKEFKPGQNGESPLADATDWVNCKCPKCGSPAKRETDTMPQWAGSSWYYLRYLDPHNDKELASSDKMKYWMNVDVYNGGTEHITRHLIYSRFWHRFLYDNGIVNTPEPYQRRTTIGLVLGPDGQKMSKSRGNTINPDDVIKEYGADVLRCYVLFMGDYGAEAPWNEQGVKGISRFLDRVIRLGDKVVDGASYTKAFEPLINKTIQKVGTDIDNLKYNTAISALMSLVNEYYTKETITKEDYRILQILLYPFAPHLAEELNDMYNLGEVICKSSWPKVDESKLIEEEKEIAVQVNGKVRATIKVSINDSEEEMQQKAMQEENVQKHIEGKQIIKTIVIKGKIVNIVVK